jgi:AAA+ superfamily predicted ATPase
MTGQDPEGWHTPSIARTEWNGSVAEIHNPSELVESAQMGPLRIFDRADFGSPVVGAYLDLSPSYVQDGEPRVEAVGSIHLDHLNVNNADPMEMFARRYPVRGRDESGIILGRHRHYKDIFYVSDSENGGTTLLVFGHTDDGKISLSSRNLMGEPFLHQPADKTAFLRGVARIFMRTVEHAYGASLPEGNLLNRTYRFGVEPKAPHYIPRALGREAVVGATAAPQYSEGADVEELGIVEIIDEAVSLEDIGGLAVIKDQLRDIALSFRRADIMAKWGATRPQGILFYGESGGGKTMLAHALAHEIGASVWSIQSSDIYKRWHSQSEQKMKDLFDKARAVEEPTVLLFDEIDSIISISDHPSGSDIARNAVAGIFKQELNTLAQTNPNVLVIGTTNRPDSIDPAIIRSGRFNHRIYVPMPDEIGRAQIASGIVGKAISKSEGTDFNPYADDINTIEIAHKTDGMSGADVAEIFRRITMQHAIQEARTGSVVPISQRDIIATISAFRTNG